MKNFCFQNPLIRLPFHAAEPMQAIRKSSTRVRHFSKSPFIAKMPFPVIKFTQNAECLRQKDVGKVNGTRTI
jgi:hypothetical protein